MKPQLRGESREASAPVGRRRLALAPRASKNAATTVSRNHHTLPARRLLLIDDDQELGALLTDYFAGVDYSLSVASNATDGIRQAVSGDYALVLLDVMLPQFDGFEVLRQLRRGPNADLPVIMLTAKTATDDRVEGFTAGADDYITKPFDPIELSARIGAVLRRSGQSTPNKPVLLAVGRYRLDPATRRAWRHDQLLDLTAIEFDILELLMRSAGRVVSRDRIFSTLNHREATPFDRSIDVHICHLRRKLILDSDASIRSVRGVGYLFLDLQ